MSYCINPNCGNRRNVDSSKYCQTCGTNLLIKERYQLVRPLRELHSSPYVEVFEVDDQGTRKVLKILKIDNQDLLRLFQREAQVLVQLRHQGIPRIEEGGYFTYSLRSGFRELHCLVMEKIEGQDLWQWLQKHGRISEDLALDWLRQFTKILDQVHQKGLFHRDIKPSNIMVRPNSHLPNGELVLIDFGAARWVTQTVVEGQGDVTAVFTLGYAAPEQIRRKAVLQSDFFALGRTFVHLLTGNNPIDLAEDSQTGQLIWRDSAPQISAPLANFIDEMMAPSVEHRPRSTQIILQRLDNLINGTTTAVPLPRQASRLPWILTGAVILTGVLCLIGPTPQRCLPATAIPRLKHDDDVNAVAFSPNSKYLATASLDKTAQVWDIASRCQVASIQHSSSVVAVTFSPSGKYLVTASLDGTAKIQEVASHNIIATLRHNDGVVAVAFSPDGEKLATASADGTARVWAVSGKPIGAPLKHGAYVRTVTFSRDGKYLATASLDNTARVWRITSGQEVKPVGPPLEHNDAVVAVAFSPDGKKLATGSVDGTAQMWAVGSGKPVGRPLKHQNGMVAVAFSPDGRKLATVSSDNTAQVLNTTSGDEDLSLQKGNVSAIAFSPNGKYLARALRNNTVRVLEQKGSSYQEVACLQHEDRVVAVTFSPDGKYLATASWDKTARFWEVASRQDMGCQK